MDDPEFIADRIAALEESVRFFSSSNKPERERWVVGKFLEALNVPYASSDVISPDDDPPDVAALGGRFEVKEILDPGRRRHQGYKKELEKAREATTAQDLLTTYTPIVSSIEEIFQLCLTAMDSLENRYAPTVRARLDLLFYVNLRHVMEVRETPFPDTSILPRYGWRSVSFVKGQAACCFYAAEGAPLWLKEQEGCVRHKVWE